jgi:phage terminase small subunit
MPLNGSQRLFCQYLAQGVTRTQAATMAGYAAPSMTSWRLVQKAEVREEVERLKTASTEVTVLPTTAKVPAPKSKTPPIDIDEATVILSELARARTTISTSRVAALKLLGLWRKWEDASPKVGLIINLGNTEQSL